MGGGSCKGALGALPCCYVVSVSCYCFVRKKGNRERKEKERRKKEKKKKNKQKKRKKEKNGKISKLENFQKIKDNL
jgi:beta-lactamase regulating signal transducer with metallopeptidase domain